MTSITSTIGRSGWTCPNPYLFCFVASVEKIKNINGFDQVFRRGFDHLGDVDFLLRWKLSGQEYKMIEEPLLLHPGLVGESPEEIQKMHFESAINRRYFYDRYGEDVINRLKPPFKVDSQVIDVGEWQYSKQPSQSHLFEIYQ